MGKKKKQKVATGSPQLKQLETKVKRAVQATHSGQAKPKRSFLEQIDLWADRYAIPLLTSILLLSLLVRIAALLSLSDSVYYDFLLWDERVYHTWAVKIASGTFQASGAYEMAPFPAYLMGLVYWLFSPDIFYIRFMNIIFGVLTCWLIYLIGKEILNRLAGLAACLVAALYKPFIFYSIVPLKTALEVLLFALVAWLLVSLMNKTATRNSLLKALFLGVAAGLVFNVRPNAGILMPFLPVLMMWGMYRDRKSLAVTAATLLIYAVGISVALAPFMIRNYLVTGGKAGAASMTQSGFNLYICNSLEGGYPTTFATTSPFEQGIQFTIEASRRVGRKLTAGEASAYWRNEVIKSVREHPWAYVEKYTTKMINSFDRTERDDHYHIGFMSSVIPFFKFPFFAFWFVLPIGMAGMLMTAWRSRKSFALLAVFLLYASTLIVFFTNTRVRLLLLAILIPMAVAGIMELQNFIKEKQFVKVWIFAGIVLVFTVAEFVPSQGGDDLTAYYNTHAIALNSRGFEREALQYWEKSSRMEGHYSAFANLALAGKYYMRGNREKALSYLDRIPDTSFAVASKYETLGDIAVREGQLDKAVSSYERAISVNSGLRNPRIKLIKILERTDPARAAEEKEKLKYINSFYNIY